MLCPYTVGGMRELCAHSPVFCRSADPVPEGCAIETRSPLEYMASEETSRWHEDVNICPLGKNRLSDHNDP